jgi:hypothetical protein
LTIGSRFSGLVFIASAMMFGTNIDTVTPWNGTSSISPYGVPNTATYGQIITADGTGSLLSFSAEIACSAVTPIRLEVYAWNGTNATGPNLYESPVMSLPVSGTFQLVTFNIGGAGIPLAAGSYVLFGTTSKDQGGAVNSACQWGSAPTSTYPAGHFVFLNNGTNTALWTTSTWLSITTSNMAFRATITGGTPVTTGIPGTPAPGSITLVALGLISLGLLGRWLAVPRSST